MSVPPLPNTKRRRPRSASAKFSGLCQIEVVGGEFLGDRRHGRRCVEPLSVS